MANLFSSIFGGIGKGAKWLGKGLAQDGADDGEGDEGEEESPWSKAFRGAKAGFDASQKQGGGIAVPNMPRQPAPKKNDSQPLPLNPGIQENPGGTRNPQELGFDIASEDMHAHGTDLPSRMFGAQSDPNAVENAAATGQPLMTEGEIGQQKPSLAVDMTKPPSDVSPLPQLTPTTAGAGAQQGMVERAMQQEPLGGSNLKLGSIDVNAQRPVETAAPMPNLGIQLRGQPPVESYYKGDMSQKDEPWPPSDKYGWGYDPIKSAEYDAVEGKDIRAGKTREQIDHPGKMARLKSSLFGLMNGAAAGARANPNDPIGGAIGGGGAGAIGAGISPKEGNRLAFKTWEEPGMLADEARYNQKQDRDLAVRGAEAKIGEAEANTANTRAQTDRTQQQTGFDKNEESRKQRTADLQAEAEKLQNEITQETKPEAIAAIKKKLELVNAQIAETQALGSYYMKMGNYYAQPGSSTRTPQEEKQIDEQAKQAAGNLYSPDEQQKEIYDHYYNGLKQGGISDQTLQAFQSGRNISDGDKERINKIGAISQKQAQDLVEQKQARLAATIGQLIRAGEKPGRTVTNDQFLTWAQANRFDPTNNYDEARRVASKVLGWKIADDPTAPTVKLRPQPESSAPPTQGIQFGKTPPSNLSVRGFKFGK